MSRERDDKGKFVKGGTMRSLKFRVWSKKYNTYFGLSGLHYENGKIDGIFAISGILAGIPDVIFLEPEDVVLEQDTGLTDKNGKEIYEGDIVSEIGVGIAQVIDSPTGEWMLYYRREPDEINSGFVSVVPKNKPNGLWKANTTSYIEVIGNIHENPELLGGEE